MDRATFYGGPAYLTWNSATIQMEDDWKTDDEIKTFEVNTNLQGKVDSREDEVSSKLDFQALGFWANVLQLVTYQPGDRGKLIFPSTHLPAAVQAADGKSVTYSAAAITKMPQVVFSAMKQLLGRAELTCLRKNNTAGSNASAFDVVANSPYAVPALDPANIIIEPWTCAWGSTSPFSSMETEDGIIFEPVVDLQPTKN